MVVMFTREKVPRDPARQRRRGEAPLQLPGRVPAERAYLQFAGFGPAHQQQVDCPKLDAAGLARPGAGDDQHGALDVADDLLLAGIRLRPSGARWRAQCPWVSPVLWPGGSGTCPRSSG